MTDQQKQQIEQEAGKRYIKGCASYFAFIYGAEYALEHEDNGNDTSSVHNE
jgi:hypothetical protein